MCEVFCIDRACCVRFNPCERKTRFDQGRSLTYVETGGSWKIQYFTGGVASGFFGNDTFQFGSSYYSDGELVVTGTVFGQALRIPENFINHAAEGVVGMGFQKLAVGNVTPPLLRAVHLGLLDQPLFTVFLRRVGGGQMNADGGLITYGGIDAENCGSVIAFEPLIEPCYWQFKLSVVSSTNFTSKDGWRVISDTSSAHIVAPLGIAQTLASIFRANITSFGDYIVNCDTKAEISLTIVETTFTISSENIVVPIGNETCLLALRGMAGNQFGPTWIIGDPFIRQYCHIYDIAKEQIGFAESLQK